MAHLASGDAHGSRVMEDCTDREGYGHVGEGDNKSRFAAAAVMYGWLGASDRRITAGDAELTAFLRRVAGYS